MNPFNLQVQDALNRRVFLRNTTAGPSALAGLTQAKTSSSGLPGFPTHAAKAKRIIYLFQSGAPSQMDLFDPKPAITIGAARICPIYPERSAAHHDDLRPEEVSGAPTIFKFRRHGQSGRSSANCCRTCPSRPTSWR